MRPAVVVPVLLVLALAAPVVWGFAPQVQDYVGPGDGFQTSVTGPGIGTQNLGGATFFFLPAGTTQVSVSVVDDAWGAVDFVVCQDVNANGQCAPNTADVYKETCAPVTVTGIHSTLSVRVFVIHSWKSIGFGQCTGGGGGFVGVTTGTITLTPS